MPQPTHQPHLHPITEPDLPTLAAFLERHRRPNDPPPPPPLPPEQRLRWLLLDNPARTPDMPLGWLLRTDAGHVVGTMLCVPLRVAVNDVQRTALMSCKFYVDEPHRGLGLALFMRFRRESRRFPLIATSANAASGALFAQFGGYPIAGTDHTMLGVARPAPLVEEWLHRRSNGRAPARWLALPAKLAPRRTLSHARNATASELLPLRSSEVDSLRFPPPPPNTIAAVRDAAFIRWRYFPPAGGQDVYRFRAPHEPHDRLVVVNQTRAGHRNQIRVLNVLDVWPPTDPTSALSLVAHLTAHYANQFDTLWLRAQPPEVEATLQSQGFRRHAFPAPLGWCIATEAQLPTRHWYLVPGESE